MSRHMISASATLRQLQHRLDTISNNIANVNTAGYKKREATFQEALTQSLENQPHHHKELGRITSNGLRMGHGAIIGQTYLNYQQGAPQLTERPLDVMIDGEAGWFRTLREWLDGNGVPQSEVVYTRNGSFYTQPMANGNLRLVTAQGNPVLDVNNLPITFGNDFDKIDISAEGTMRVFYADSPNDPEAIQISIAHIHRPDLMESLGENQFRITGMEDELENEGILTRLDISALDATTRPFSLRQGALEMSNVDLTHELTQLLSTQRMMQFQSRSISIAYEMQGIANSIRQ